MEERVLANADGRVAVAAAATAGEPKGLVKRLKATVSTNIGLYEIRMNLFLWGLFRMGRQKEN